MLSSAAARERRTLGQIEKTVLADDLRLAALFTAFTRLARDDAMPRTEQVEASHGRLVKSAMLAALGLIVVTGLLLSLLAPARAACTGAAVTISASSRSSATSAASAAACPAGRAAGRGAAHPKLSAPP